MSFFLSNPLMLLGLLGIGLPVIAHLLSRKKYDVVNWGAMQFLQLGRKAKRRIKLEEFWLLALRIGLIALMAIAMTRPWLTGSLVSGFAAAPAGDYVLIIDSSYSAAWRGAAKTPHQRAVNWAQQFLDQLSPADTVAVLDARDVATPVVPTLIRDRVLVRRAIEELSPPSGTSKLPEAIVKGLQLLNTGTSASRHVVVITDGQTIPWQNSDEHFWLQLQELRSQATVPPEVWVHNTQEQQARRTNYSLDRLQLSRELTVSDFPVRIKTRLRNTGAGAAMSRKVFLEVDGQRLADQTQTVRIEADGQATIEFEQRFKAVGPHLVAVVTEEDNLPDDDRSEAAISITAALPVLLVDGQPHADVTRTETFFAKAALSASGNSTPWIAATVASVGQLTKPQLGTQQVVVLANVARLTDEQIQALSEFVESGGGLAITLGDQANREWHNGPFFDNGKGLLPARLTSIELAPVADDAESITVSNESLQLPWLKQFRAGASDGLLEARFTQWFKVDLAALPVENLADAKSAVVAASVVTARLSNGEPWLVSKSYGRGQVLLMTSSIDADWTTLPAKPDYVAFMHELIFELSSGRVARNVDVGASLIVPLPADTQASDWQFRAPGGQEHDAQLAGDELRPLLRSDETAQPGIYRLHRRDKAVEFRDEVFVVNADRAESDLNPLPDDRWSELTADDRLHRIKTPRDLAQSLKSDHSRVEIWHLLMLVFLAMLVGEVVMTRRLVQGGHLFVDPE